MASNDHRAEIWTTPDCADCRAAKQYLAREGVPTEEHDISEKEHLDELKKITGKTIVPTIIIDGKHTFVGFSNNRADIDELLSGERNQPTMS